MAPFGCGWAALGHSVFIRGWLGFFHSALRDCSSESPQATMWPHRSFQGLPPHDRRLANAPDRILSHAAVRQTVRESITDLANEQQAVSREPATASGESQAVDVFVVGAIMEPELMGH